MEPAYRRLCIKTDKKECIEWTGGKFNSGYGTVYYNGKNRRAHRVSYELNIASIPDGLHVCHTCDNPLCINPNHLFLGSHRDNMRDKVSKNRQWKRGHPTKLSKNQANSLRKSYTGKYGDIARLAEEYGINRSTVREYLRRSEDDEWNPPVPFDVLEETLEEEKRKRQEQDGEF